jgi:hypothetical protein
MLSRRTNRGMSTALVIALGVGFVLSQSAVSAQAEEEELPVTFSAIAANVGVRGPRGQTRLDITIAAWSTPENQASLIDGLKEGGRRSLSDALRGQERVGRIRQVQQLGHDIQYSRTIPMADGARQIILATDRPMGFAEVSRNTRSRDYNVTLIVLNVDAEGQGEGQMMLGAQFDWNEETEQLVITQLSSEPIRLNSVRIR